MSYSVFDLAQHLNAKIIGDGAREITGAGTIQNGSSQQIGFIAESSYRKFAANTQLGALIVNEPIETQAAQLIVTDVKSSWRRIAALFDRALVDAGIHSSAIISSSAVIGDNVNIGAGSVIGDGVSIGQGTRIDSGVLIEEGVSIGQHCHICSGVKLLRRVSIGNRVFIDSGAVIGSRGFGYSHDSDGWHIIAQLGSVRLEDDVDIGANTTIDRGAIEDTVICTGAKLDNLIQIGHNVVIGERTILAGACIIAGSVTFGADCVVGGASVFAGHIHICDGAQFTGHSSVSKSITQPGAYSSALTVMPIRQWRRFVAKLKLFGKEK